MAKGLVTNTYLTNIGNAIRTKLGVQTTYTPSQMAAAIESIPTGGSNVIDLTTGVKFAYSTFSALPSQIANADWSDAVDGRYMFYYCDQLTSFPEIDTSSFNTMSYMFYRCSSLTSIPLLDTGNVTAMGDTFYGCSALTSIPQFNTSKVYTMNGTFQGCTSITSVPLLDTSSVTSMSSLFNGCTNLATVPQLNTAKVTGSGMSSMFKNCSSLSNTSLNNILAMCIAAVKITNVNYMTLKSIGLSSGQALTCEGLSNWSAFLAAGWTSGY